MKKLYTFSLMVAAMLTASANVNDQVVSEAFMKYQPIQELSLETVAPVKAPAKAPAATAVAGEYVGQYYGMLNSNSGWQDLAITITANSETELTLVGFYSTYPVKATYDASTGNISIASGQFLLHNTKYDEDVLFKTYRWNEAGNDIVPTESLVGVAQADGSIKFDLDDIFSAEISLGYFNMGYAISLSRKPEVESTIAVTGDICSGSNVMDYTVEVENVPVIKVFGISGDYPGSTNNFKVAAANGKAISAGQNSYNFNGEEHGIATLFVVGVDKNDNVLCGQACKFFVDKSDPTDWVSLGTGEFVEDIVSAIYKFGDDVHLLTYAIEVQVNAEDPTYYRLVNPFGAGTPYESYAKTDHNHYMYINAADPKKVLIEKAPLGIEVVTGAPLWLTSVAPKYGDVGGILENGVITFSEKSLVYEKGQTNSAYYVPFNGGTKITIPSATSAIEDVEVAEEATAVYYNLQGIQVANPVEGQIYIVKTGNKVAKQFIQK